MARVVVIFVAVLTYLSVVNCDLTCKDQEGKSVDWFIVYKLPKHFYNPEYHVSDGYTFFYMDVNKPEWMISKVPINRTGQAVHYTLQQIYDNYKSEEVAYLLYNDETPDKTKSSSHGHTKGDLCFDRSTGFWLVHSVPRFPRNGSLHYVYPESGSHYGQTFLCVTYNYKSLDEIGKQLLYTYPQIYDYNIPKSFAADNLHLKSAVDKKHVESKPWKRSVTLSSRGGEMFTSFAKYSNFDADLYHDWLAVYYHSDVYAETWGHDEHRLLTNCSGQYKAYNVKHVQLLHAAFNETQDHAKWAITSEKTMTCIGDINRVASQEERAGGTVCMTSKSVWKQFDHAITDYESCPRKQLL